MVCMKIFLLFKIYHRTSMNYADFDKVHLLKILLNKQKNFIKQKGLRIIFLPLTTPLPFLTQKLKT